MFKAPQQQHTYLVNNPSRTLPQLKQPYHHLADYALCTNNVALLQQSLTLHSLKPYQPLAIPQHLFLPLLLALHLIGNSQWSDHH